MATCPSIRACRIPWTEEPGGLQSMGSQRVQHNRAHTRTLVGNMVNFSVCDSFIYNIWHMIKKLQVIEKASMVD